MISLRTQRFCRDLSGWGLINEELMALDRLGDQPVHLFASFPRHFKHVEPQKFNVALTVTDHPDIGQQYHGFADRCNQMNLMLVTSEVQKGCLERGGVTVPIEIVDLGHNHAKWHSSTQRGSNTTSMILDRGRDHQGGVNELAKFFNEIVYMNCTSAGEDYTDDDLKAAYQDADVFFKWSREAWCFPILEAMSAGCLVITCCHGDVPYLKPDQNCLVFDTIEEMQHMLGMAAQNSYDEIKQAGQETAAALSWHTSLTLIRYAINRHFSRSLE